MDIGKVKQVEITAEVQKSYLDYAMSVIVARALPDVRDGLKPVHRRILFTMQQMGLRPGGPFTKSVKVVGEVMGKYHPHGDMPVYDALVRLAQDFSMRYPLVYPQGNFGSIDGDPPAAMRYTEVRLAKIAEEMLGDIEAETVLMVDNFDATLKEPAVLPAKIPNLLLMGAEGIAVGMATKIPPHNLAEVAAAIAETIKIGKLTPTPKTEESEQPDGEKKESVEFTIEKIRLEATGTDQKPEIFPPKLTFSSEVTIEDLLSILPGPDFPTGGAIYDARSLLEVYATGRGRILLRGIAKIETADRGKAKIVITEIPYQVNKAQLVVRIATLARDKKINGISEIRDESDRKGMSVVIELKRNANPKAILNNLYKHTALQSSFPANFVVLVDGIPRILNLKQILIEYVNHRQKIIVARTIYQLRTSRRRGHILEGLKVAIDHIDQVIETIKRAADPDQARERLMQRFALTEIQATAILDMQLRRLARLEREKIEDELLQINRQITDFEKILRNPDLILKIIESEVKNLTQEYQDPRRTKIYKERLGEFSQEDLVAKEETLITLTRGGYIKRVPLGLYRQQARGGKGITGMTRKADDEIVQLTFASTHDQLLAFTDKGRVLSVPVWEIPESSRISRGQAIVNFVNIGPDEQIQTILALGKNGEASYLFMSTKMGVVKKTPVSKFANIKGKGIVAIKLEGGDKLAWVHPTSGEDVILLVSRLGKAIRFSERGVRAMGRATVGVRGIKLARDDSLVGMEVFSKEKDIAKGKRKKSFRDILLVTEHGLGKRTPVHLFRLQKRAGMGVKAASINQRTGQLNSAILVNENIEQLILTSKAGQVIKLPIRNIPQLARTAQGVILMRFGKSQDSIAAVTTVPKEEEGN